MKLLVCTFYTLSVVDISNHYTSTCFFNIKSHFTYMPVAGIDQENPKIVSAESAFSHPFEVKGGDGRALSH